ncbi:NYN domain-containing protein [Collybia nuda]|uniref:NYN domain-containing protein n=1 Tax=Collybia nuda TaxID=64659 RepID=A0A9P5YA39_9AGAR|nr:NYN domain-containing protein [Collybia nuda]
MERVAIFWDIDSCPVPAKLTGYEAINNIRNLAYSYGSATTFKAYVDSSNVSPARLQSVRHQFESSGLLLIEYKRGDGSNIATHTMIADMLVFAIDHPAPATIILISGKNELAYAASLLRHRRYQVIVVASLSPNETLKSQASVILDWDVVASQPISEKPIPEITFGSFSPFAGESRTSHYGYHWNP